MGILNSKELVPRRPTPIEGNSEYEIIVETGNVEGAGTNNLIFSFLLLEEKFRKNSPDY